MGNYVIVTYEDNWADEMDVKYIKWMPISEVEKLYRLIDIYFQLNSKIEHCVGTNEEITITANPFTYKEIKAEELLILKNYIKFDNFVSIFDINFWLEGILDDEDVETFLLTLEDSDILFIKDLLKEE